MANRDPGASSSGPTSWCSIESRTLTSRSASGSIAASDSTSPGSRSRWRSTSCSPRHQPAAEAVGRAQADGRGELSVTRHPPSPVRPGVAARQITPAAVSSSSRWHADHRPPHVVVVFAQQGAAARHLPRGAAQLGHHTGHRQVLAAERRIREHGRSSRARRNGHPGDVGGRVDQSGRDPGGIEPTNELGGRQRDRDRGDLGIELLLALTPLDV